MGAVHSIFHEFVGGNIQTATIRFPSIATVVSLYAPVNVSGSDGYQYCNMPHPHPLIYEPLDGKLLSLDYFMTTHRRTPIVEAPDTFYNCTDTTLLLGINGVSNVFIPESGHCLFPQLTPLGFEDAQSHGEHIWSVYGAQLGMLPTVPARSSVTVYSLDSDICKMTASGILRGIWSHNQVQATLVPIHVISRQPVFNLNAQLDRLACEACHTNTTQNGYSFKVKPQRLQSKLIASLFERLNTKHQSFTLTVTDQPDITALARALGVLEPRLPGFGANIAIEVWSVKGTRFARILYSGAPAVTRRPQDMSLTSIPLDLLVNRLAATVNQTAGLPLNSTNTTANETVELISGK